MSVRRIGENVARLRNERGMSQTSLADRMREVGQIHWRQTTVSRVERGIQGVTMSEATSLVNVLGSEVLVGTSFEYTREHADRKIALGWRLRNARERIGALDQEFRAIVSELDGLLARLDAERESSDERP